MGHINWDITLHIKKLFENTSIILLLVNICSAVMYSISHAELCVFQLRKAEWNSWPRVPSTEARTILWLSLFGHLQPIHILERAATCCGKPGPSSFPEFNMKASWIGFCSLKEGRQTDRQRSHCFTLSFPLPLALWKQGSSYAVTEHFTLFVVKNLAEWSHLDMSCILSTSFYFVK